MADARKGYAGGGGRAGSFGVRLAWGAASGAILGAFAGLLFAAESLLRNPGIGGFRDRAIVLGFFPLFYLAIGLAVGIGVSLVLTLLPRRLRDRFPPAAGPLAAGLVAGFFFLLEGLTRCYPCHQWYRDIIPSLTFGAGTASFVF